MQAFKDSSQEVRDEAKALFVILHARYPNVADSFVKRYHASEEGEEEEKEEPHRLQLKQDFTFVKSLQDAVDAAMDHAASHKELELLKVKEESHSEEEDDYNDDNDKEDNEDDGDSQNETDYIDDNLLSVSSLSMDNIVPINKRNAHDKSKTTQSPRISPSSRNAAPTLKKTENTPFAFLSPNTWDTKKQQKEVHEKESNTMQLLQQAKAALHSAKSAEEKEKLIQRHDSYLQQMAMLMEEEKTALHNYRSNSAVELDQNKREQKQWLVKNHIKKVQEFAASRRKLIDDLEEDLLGMLVMDIHLNE